MFRAIIFDFDYTLADSSAGAIECINYALTHLGFSSASEERIRQTIGLSLPATFTALTQNSDPHLIHEFSKRFVERADQVMADLAVVYDHVPQVLEPIRSAGLQMGIVSTKYRYRIENILTRYDLLHYFDVIVGGEDVQRHKPDPCALERAYEQLDISPQHAVYVGDHPVDAEAAQRAGMSCVAVLTGTSTKADFTGWPVLRFMDCLDQLPAIIFSPA